MPVMKRYAFIDAPNTSGTTRECLGFIVDWAKLFKFLKNEKWNCEEVFFYKGYKGDKEKNQLEKLEQDIGFSVRTKLTHAHPDRTIDIPIKCGQCENEFLYKYTIRGNRKSNCDVELTVDALKTLSKGDEALIFTGDGDVAYLIETLRDNGVTIFIVSSKERDGNGNKRFSTRLTDILKKEGIISKKVKFLDINRWRSNIEKLEEEKMKTASPERSDGSRM